MSPGYADPIQFQSGNPYGASFQSNNGTVKPDETARASARFQGRRVAETTTQFLAGKPAEAPLNATGTGDNPEGGSQSQPGT